MKKFYETDQLICYIDFNKAIIRKQLLKSLDNNKIIMIFSDSGTIMKYTYEGFLNTITDEQKNYLAIYQIPKGIDEEFLIKLVNSWVKTNPDQWTAVAGVTRGTLEFKKKNNDKI